MWFRPRIAALCALLVMSAALAVVASARAEVPSAPAGQRQSAGAGRELDSTGSPSMKWGGGGGGSWVRVYANREHVFAVIAGLRWDTSYSTDGDRTGPGWSEELRPTGGFRLRHPLGLLAATPLS